MMYRCGRLQQNALEFLCVGACRRVALTSMGQLPPSAYIKAGHHQGHSLVPHLHHHIIFGHGEDCYLAQEHSEGTK